jgi:hypothetical protein
MPGRYTIYGIVRRTGMQAENRLVFLENVRAGNSR